MFSGVFTLEQGAGAATVPSTSCAFRLGATGAGNGMLFSMLLSNDEMRREMSPSFLTQANTWSLFDGSAGGNPCTIANW